MGCHLNVATDLKLSPVARSVRRHARRSRQLFTCNGHNTVDQCTANCAGSAGSNQVFVFVKFKFIFCLVLLPEKP